MSVYGGLSLKLAQWQKLPGEDLTHIKTVLQCPLFYLRNRRNTEEHHILLIL